MRAAADPPPRQAVTRLGRIGAAAAIMIGSASAQDTGGATAPGDAASTEFRSARTCMATADEHPATAGRLIVLVYEATPCLPVHAARIELAGLRREAVTGSDGLAVLDGIPPGRHALHVSDHLGRVHQRFVTAPPEGGNTVLIDVGR